MSFPEGRLYTIQLTNDELAWLMGLDALWEGWRINTLQDAVLLKLDQANSIRQQDNSIAYLYKSEQERNDSLKRMLKSAVAQRNEAQEKLKEAQCT